MSGEHEKRQEKLSRIRAPEPGGWSEYMREHGKEEYGLGNMNGGELYRPQLKPFLLDLVCRPIIQSLLYDADLLPEQLSSQKNMTVGLFSAYSRLEGVLLAFKYLECEDPKEPAPGFEENNRDLFNATLREAADICAGVSRTWAILHQVDRSNAADECEREIRKRISTEAPDGK